MSKIGIIYVGFNTEEYIQASLAPWIAARKNKLLGHDFFIAAVSMPFEGFNCGEKDKTQNILQEYRNCGDIDILFDGDTPVKETIARGHALKELIHEECVFSIMVDSDEIWLEEQIIRSIQFVEKNPLITWFKICYKNYVFNEKTYLVDPFTPPRIHRLNHNGHKAYGFWDDNNISYTGGITRDLKKDTQFPSAIIPKNQVFVRHLSWLSDERSRRKVEYQIARSWTPSFLWNYEDSCLIFNPALPEPEIAKDFS